MFRRRHLTALAVPVAAVFSLAASSAELPAGADESSCELVTDTAGTCRIPAWISCDEAAGGKVSFYASVNNNAPLVLEEPTGSYQDGDFCGEPENSAASGAAQDNIHVFTFQGLLEGNVQDLTVNLYDLAFASQRTGGDIDLTVRIAINGASPSGFQTNDTTGTQSPATFPVTVAPVDVNDGSMQMYTFTLTGLDQHVKGLMRDGFGDRQNEIKITIDSPANGAHAFVWGAAEVPAGIIMNPGADDELGTIVEFAPQ